MNDRNPPTLWRASLQFAKDMIRLAGLPMVLGLVVPSVARAEVRFAHVFGDHQVLQREMPVPVWGTAKPGEAVAVTFAAQTKRTVADGDGRWTVRLDPMPASAEPRELRVQDQTLKDVLVGDVWMCAGPSGGFERSTASLYRVGAAEVSKASHPLVRLLRPVLYGSLMPLEDIDRSSRWTPVRPESIGIYPISWYFGRELHAVTGVPVGLIQVHSPSERLGEWVGWKLDPTNPRQVQMRTALSGRLAQDIVAIERWLEETREWNVGQALERGFPFPTHIAPEVQGPSVLSPGASWAYNYNVAPFVGMGLRGVVFLNEFGKASFTKDAVSAVIRSWREAWGRPQMPFLLPERIQNPPGLPSLEEVLGQASALPMVHVIARPADADSSTPNATLWKEVASAATKVPIGPAPDEVDVRRWEAATPVQPLPDPAAQLEAACVFGNHMVVQAGMPVPVWGWGEPGAEVTVSFAAQQVKATISKRGEWRVVLAPLTVSRTPAQMTITSTRNGRTERLTFDDALVGEVWGNSGQSNAGRVMGATLGFAEEQPKAHWPEIRYLRVVEAGSGFPLHRARGTWVVVTPETVGMMPGQGYYFAKQIHQQLKTPCGILNSSAGGSTIFAWTTEAALSSSPKLKPLLDQMLKHREARAARFPALRESLRIWVEGARRNGNLSRPMPFYPVDALLLEPIEARGGLLYNAMIHPILGTALRGFLWNQGEADTGAGIRSEGYTELMESMVADWRKSWRHEFPFYFVQMPAVKGRPGLTQMWDSQTSAMNRIPKSGMMVCNDISDGDIHPADKKSVGERLSRLALVRTYGVEGMTDSSPFMKEVVREGNRVVVSFAPVGNGLKTRDGKAPNSWELAGPDGKFFAARAEIAGDRVLISAEGIPEPVAVRLGWSADSNCNLTNSEGLPAMPFSAKIE